MVRHRFLVPACKGSNPFTPDSQQIKQAKEKESNRKREGKSSIAKDLAKAIAKERRAKQKVKGKLSFGQSNREGKANLPS